MAEAIIARREHLRAVYILELGAGLGLASIVAARVVGPTRVVVTDMDDEGMLALARANLAANVGGDGGDVVVRALDWEKEGSGGDGVDLDGPPDVILAADVVYDDRLTDAFFTVLRRLLWPPTGLKPQSTPYCLLALERRPVFSAAHLRVVAPGYDRFREQLAWGKGQTPWPLEGRQLNVKDVPIAYVGVEGEAAAVVVGRSSPWRGGEVDDGCLELWEIRARVESGSSVVD